MILVPPPVPRGWRELTLASSYPLRLLGVSTRIWVFDRRYAPEGNPAQRGNDAMAVHW